MGKENTKEVEIANINPILKDAFFQKVFESEKRKKQLVSFLDKIDIKELEIAPVTPILFGSKENDLSFLCNHVYYYMVEQQSSENPNMPYRILEYITAGLRSFIEPTDMIYRNQRVLFAMPKLYTIFTGCKKKSSQQIKGEQRLSDLYLVKEGIPDLEVVVHTYDFSMSYEEILTYMNTAKIANRFVDYEKEDLFWYGVFANCATYLQRMKKDNQLEKPKQTQTIWELCQLFLKRGVFTDLFESKEVCNMAVVQYSREEQLKWIGKEEGIAEGIRKSMIKMYHAGMSLDEIGRIMDLSKEELQEFMEEEGISLHP